LQDYSNIAVINLFHFLLFLYAR